LDEAEAVAKKSLKVINRYFDVVAGIGIRCLNQHLLSYVFGYLPLSASLSTVCKYWKWTVASCRTQPVHTPQKKSGFEKLKIKAPASPSSEGNNYSSPVPQSSPAPRVPKLAIAAGSPQSPPNALAAQRTIPRQRHDYEEDSPTSLLTAVTHSESVFLHKPIRSPKAASNGSLPSARIRPVRAHDPTKSPAATAEAAMPKAGLKTASTDDAFGSKAASAAVGLQESSANRKKSTATSPVEAAAKPDSVEIPQGRENDRLKLPKVAEGKEPRRVPTRRPADFTRLRNNQQGQQTGISDWREPGKGSNWGLNKALSPKTPNEGLVYDDFEDEVVTGDMERSMIKEVMKMRSDQQLANLIEYVQAGFAKIEDLEGNKRRLKKIFRAWNVRFEKANGREPTLKDRKAVLKEQYMEYDEVKC
jgi:hypothetical protein